MSSAADNPLVISEYIKEELALGRLIPIQTDALNSFPAIQLSLLGAIPKHSQPNKWCLIMRRPIPDIAALLVSRQSCEGHPKAWHWCTYGKIGS